MTSQIMPRMEYWYKLIILVLFLQSNSAKIYVSLLAGFDTFLDHFVGLLFWATQ